jgi:hypothetical protein
LMTLICDMASDDMELTARVMIASKNRRIILFIGLNLCRASPEFDRA